MNKRSKVLLIILLLFLFVTLLSVLVPKGDSQKQLDDFEEEITNPNNQLEQLNSSNNSLLLIDIAKGIDNIISKIIDFFISGISNLIEDVL